VEYTSRRDITSEDGQCVDFHMPEDIKQKIKEFWDRVPCGTNGIPYAEGTLEYYEAVSKNRYRKELFLKEFAEFDKWNGKKVLEVGCGVGSDLLEFSKNGAIMTGIDLSSKSVALAKKRLNVYGLKAEVLEADVESLPFDNEIFDAVYSCGVIHHTPDITKAISEIHRVLKPNGEIRIMIYHKPSIVCLQLWILYGLFYGKPFRRLDDIFWEQHESIGTKIYTVNEARGMFSMFRDLEVKPPAPVHVMVYMVVTVGRIIT